MHAIVFDTETTGTDDKAEVIEAAWQAVEFIDGKLSRGLCCGAARYGTSTPISWGAVSVHHILPDEIAGLEAFSIDAIPTADIYAGHKVDFDLKMCKISPKNSIDTLVIARQLWPDESHNLSALVYMTASLQGHSLLAVKERLKAAHSALEDVSLCVDLLTFMCEFSGIKDMEQLLLFANECRIPSKMAFGKFKGLPVSAVDPGWRGWYKKQAEQDPYLLEAFRRYPYKGN